VASTARLGSLFRMCQQVRSGRDMQAPVHVADVILNAGDELILVVCRDLGAAAAARNDDSHVTRILIPPGSMQHEVMLRTAAGAGR
jgi:hypothetical protein